MPFKKPISISIQLTVEADQYLTAYPIPDGKKKLMLCCKASCLSKVSDITSKIPSLLISADKFKTVEHFK